MPQEHHSGWLSLLGKLVWAFDGVGSPVLDPPITGP